MPELEHLQVPATTKLDAVSVPSFDYAIFPGKFSEKLIWVKALEKMNYGGNAWQSSAWERETEGRGGPDAEATMGPSPTLAAEEGGQA